MWHYVGSRAGKVTSSDLAQNIMGILQNAFRLTTRQRKSLAVIAVIFALSGNHVEAAQAAGSDVPTSTSSFQTQAVAPATDDPGDTTGLVVPPSYLGDLQTAKDIPATSAHYVDITAYNSEVGQCDSTPFNTANGTHVRDGIIATNALPFHTKVRFPELYGDKVFVVEDRMNARYATRVDIWMTKHADAIKFGIKHSVKMEILN